MARDRVDALSKLTTQALRVKPHGVLGHPVTLTSTRPFSHPIAGHRSFSSAAQPEPFERAILRRRQPIRPIRPSRQRYPRAHVFSAVSKVYYPSLWFSQDSGTYESHQPPRSMSTSQRPTSIILVRHEQSASCLAVLGFQFCPLHTSQHRANHTLPIHHVSHYLSIQVRP